MSTTANSLVNIGTVEQNTVVMQRSFFQHTWSKKFVTLFYFTVVSTTLTDFFISHIVYTN